MTGREVATRTGCQAWGMKSGRVNCSHHQLQSKSVSESKLVSAYHSQVIFGMPSTWENWLSHHRSKKLNEIAEVTLDASEDERMIEMCWCGFLASVQESGGWRAIRFLPLSANLRAYCIQIQTWHPAWYELDACWVTVYMPVAKIHFILYNVDVASASDIFCCLFPLVLANFRSIDFYTAKHHDCKQFQLE